MLLAALRCCLPLSAQEQKTEQRDSLVRLMQAASVQLIEKDGQTYRKAIDATFLHNGTYLVCDTALWSVNLKIIEATSNVRMMQEETVLTSDRLDYLIDDGLAKFRGSVVQLQDKDGNTLRTRILDYSTQDSTAVFKGGASMKDKDGQIMESDDGTYDSRKKLFTFTNNVNMFSDSVFVKTSLMTYDTQRNFATFPKYIDFWKDGNMLSANSGWYKRNEETFFFDGHVHALSKDQEAWSDSLFFYRRPNDLEMRSNVQLQDTTRKVFGLSDFLYYCDTLSSLTMRKRAAIAIATTEKDKDGQKDILDTVYFGADTLVYRTIKRCDVPEAYVKDAEKRLGDMNSDAVSEYRKRAAEAAAKAAAEAAKNDLEAMTKKEAMKKQKAAAKVPDATPSDTLKSQLDTLKSSADSVKVAVDSLETPLDTTKLGFLLGIGDVKIFRKDIQVRCDSMRFNDLDSIARFYKRPIVWNERNRQYTADSLYTLIRNRRMDKASLMSNAFIATQEDSVCFDQIKGFEVVAYFGEDSQLSRFDALGGANAVFYLKENETFATVNKVESKMLSGVFANGTIDKVYYYDAPKNDAYPIVQLPKEERMLKGFDWQPEKRPMGRLDITTLRERPSERTSYESHPHASFPQTDIYFPGYMRGVYRQIAVNDSLKRLPKPAKEEILEKPDSSIVSVPADSLSLKTSADSLQVKTPVDSLSKAPSDTLSKAQTDSTASVQVQKTERELRAEARKKLQQERWAKLDAKDAAKKAAKEAKALKKQRKRAAKLMAIRRKQEEKEQKLLEQYVKKYQDKVKPEIIETDGTQ